ncbi:hypothetical protein [Aquimonas voraii]|uniref:Uncharacterized protein n=1 Tax=Aquimonas voraii TaxID=265719 RepID=A0A1G6TUI8_9GAMM|nr:hypothetical protein [Aquimonas voraii]SDD32711.1 hypothetical protein SAMN04488509_1027 [Aquimonas voraii]
MNTATITMTVSDLRDLVDAVEMVDYRLAEAEALFGAMMGETQREQHRRPFFLASLGADSMDRALGDIAEPLKKLREMARAAGVVVGS